MLTCGGKPRPRRRDAPAASRAVRSGGDAASTTVAQLRAALTTQAAESSGSGAHWRHALERSSPKVRRTLAASLNAFGDAARDEHIHARTLELQAHVLRDDAQRCVLQAARRPAAPPRGTAMRFMATHTRTHGMGAALTDLTKALQDAQDAEQIADASAKALAADAVETALMMDGQLKVGARNIRAGGDSVGDADALTAARAVLRGCIVRALRCGALEGMGTTTRDDLMCQAPLTLPMAVGPWLPIVDPSLLLRRQVRAARARARGCPCAAVDGAARGTSTAPLTWEQLFAETRRRASAFEWARGVTFAVNCIAQRLSSSSSSRRERDIHVMATQVRLCGASVARDTARAMRMHSFHSAPPRQDRMSWKTFEDMLVTARVARCARSSSRAPTKPSSSPPPSG